MILVAIYLIIYGLMGFGVYFGSAILLLNLLALRCRAAAAGSTRFNATHRSEVTDQCFVTVISNAQRLLPTKYTNHTRRMIHFV